MYSSGGRFDWPLIRSLYEKGKSCAEIVRTIENPPSRQAIAAKAKKQGWSQVIVKGNPENLPAALQQGFGKDTPETRTQILELIRTGVSQAVASKAVGIHPTTLSGWKSQDADFSNAIDAARAAFLSRHHANIDKAGERDWRASSYLLERQPETKDQFSVNGHGPGGLTIVLNIDRTEEKTVEPLEADYIEAQ